eukprot:jgi/Ulvmu1/551/UM001_0559.1
MPTFTTTDDLTLSYDSLGKETDPALLLIHGWSGSSKYFCHNASEIAKQGIRVISIDLRFHGDSDKSDHGHHVARLAADLHEMLQHLQLCDVFLLGTSMGCAVIWSYIELFGQSAVKGCVFVDQAPLQNLTHDWKLGSKGCYDIASLTRMQCALESDFPAFAKGGCDACTSLPIAPDVQELLVSETLKCNPSHLASLMADHTQLDWRSLLPKISVPCLNLIGSKSGIFPPEGCAEVSRLVQCCTTAYFLEANHWLYLEAPAAFNGLVGSFVLSGNVEAVASKFPDQVSLQ